MGKLTFEEFRERCIETWWKDRLHTMGYDMLDRNCFSKGMNCFYCELSRRNPKTGKWETTLVLAYEYGGEDDLFELFEGFEDLSQVPESYKGMPERKYEQHPIQFIYGRWKRFGDALNALKKGDSLNGRKYVELYY